MIIMIKSTIIETVISEMLVFFNENNEYFSETRDVFTARLQSYIIESKKYLEAAIIGEIGNNTFDHNFIFEKDHPRGVYCNLYFQSGSGSCSIDKNGISFEENSPSLKGCLAILDFSEGI